MTQSPKQNSTADWTPPPRRHPASHLQKGRRMKGALCLPCRRNNARSNEQTASKNTMATSNYTQLCFILCLHAPTLDPAGFLNTVSRSWARRLHLQGFCLELQPFLRSEHKQTTHETAQPPHAGLSKTPSPKATQPQTHTTRMPINAFILLFQRSTFWLGDHDKIIDIDL